MQEEQMPKQQKKILGRYIVADPKICHGKPTFNGTRVMVWQVLEQVAEGMPWEQIVWAWRGRVPHEAIAEAVHLAAEDFRGTNHVRGDLDQHSPQPRCGVHPPVSERGYPHQQSRNLRTQTVRGNYRCGLAALL